MDSRRNHPVQVLATRDSSYRADRLEFGAVALRQCENCRLTIPQREKWIFPRELHPSTNCMRQLKLPGWLPGVAAIFETALVDRLPGAPGQGLPQVVQDFRRYKAHREWEVQFGRSAIRYGNR